jgi:endonuclease G
MTTEKKGSRKLPKSNEKSEVSMESLKQFVRTQGLDYLKNNNITSVGIGYKQINGKPTNEISIQFTVEEKSEPEALEELDTPLIPQSFVIDGVVVPTDVIERSFEIDYKIVEEVSPDQRKTRINPIQPGTSVANKKVSAGTIGCIVYDQKNGAPYILSNWHVLHGPQGNIGDEIVQPGPFDDNRINLNRLGKLVRSHLGAAGDCAIATIEDRAFKSDIMDLGVAIEQLGEPELGDKIIKSGRTTGVTHGLVTRVHTISKLNYGGLVGYQFIGGFEIGPDPNSPPSNGEISMGGDSGSAWIFKTRSGKPTNVLAGLHFAGETSNDPNEHAVACYSKSVFEKLEISLTPPKLEDVIPSQGHGYNPNFLGVLVEPPELSRAKGEDAYKLRDSEIIDYTHFSLTLSKTRRFAIWVAWNIDGGNLKKLSRKGIPFILDPKIPKEFQVGDELYSRNRLDRGHIARRADLLWGSIAEAKKANVDSFFFTNMTPQMENFNQSGKNGIWGKLEDAVFEDADEVDNLRVSIFGGPIFNADDRVYRGVKIPREFYKVIVYLERGVLKSKGFLLTQHLNQIEIIDQDEFKTFQVTLTEIEQRCEFTFPAKLKEVDGFARMLEKQPELERERQPIKNLDEIDW